MEIMNVRVALFFESIISRPDIVFKDLNVNMGGVIWLHLLGQRIKAILS